MSSSIDFSSQESSQKVYVSVVTVAELLMGVHRADSEERRQRRAAFVEAVISGVGVLDFTVAVARIHAEISAELARKGQLIGAHDLIIAATARCHDLRLLTGNVQEFSRVPGLRVLAFEQKCGLPGTDLLLPCPLATAPCRSSCRSWNWQCGPARRG